MVFMSSVTVVAELRDGVLHRNGVRYRPVPKDQTPEMQIQEAERAQLEAAHNSWELAQAWCGHYWNRGIAGNASLLINIVPLLLTTYALDTVKHTSKELKSILVGKVVDSIDHRLGFSVFKKRVVAVIDSQLDPTVEMEQKWVEQPSSQNLHNLKTYSHYILGAAMGAFVFGKTGDLAALGAVTGAGLAYAGSKWINQTKGKAEDEREVLNTPCVFCPSTSFKFKAVAQALERYRTNGKGKLPSMIVFGPPGTGKTMMCKRIAKEANANYMLISSSDLWKTAFPINEFNRMMSKAERCSGPTIIFIDECDKIFMNRELLKAQQLKHGGNGYAHALVDAVLAKMGSSSDKVMLLLATNHIELMEPALLSRMTYQIKLEFPALPEREKLIKALVDLEMTPEDAKLFTEEKVHEIAVLIDDFSGRRIEMLIQRILSRRAFSSDQPLTQDLIAEVVQECVDEHKKAKEELDKYEKTKESVKSRL
jgi:hypothetical protein